MPDLTLLNVAVPIPLKSGQRVKKSEISNSPSFLSQCTRATRETRFLSVMEGESLQSPERLPVQFLSSEEKQTPSLINLSKIAKYPKFGSFSFFTSGNKNNSATAEKSPLLNDLVERFLQNLVIEKEEVENLDQREKLVLDCFIRRKLKIGLEDYVLNYQSIDYGLLKVKRLEENYKMVFKSALKHLGNTFKNENNTKKKYDDILFYEHYFGSVSRQLGIPIEAFFHPNKKMKNGVKSKFPNQKTMNSKYLDNLLKSKKFRDDLDLFLDLHFLPNYTERRRKKIDNLIEKLKKKFINNQKNSLTDMRNYLEKNSKCKLPWSNYELQLARNSVKQLLDEKNTTQRTLIIHPL